MHFSFLRPFACAAVALGAATSARADYAPFQGYVEMPGNLAPMIMGNLATQNLKHLNEAHARAHAADSARAGGSTLAPSTGAPSGPRALAAAAPAERRAALESQLTRVLAGWSRIAAALRLPPDDVAGAVAACVAGSYMVVHDTDVPDRDFVALVAQMRSTLRSNERFMQATAARRREIYEELAIIGTLLATGREAMRRGQASPQAIDALHRNARANLDRLLGPDAGRAVLTARGLEIR